MHLKALQFLPLRPFALAPNGGQEPLALPLGVAGGHGGGEGEGAVGHGDGGAEEAPRPGGEGQQVGHHPPGAVPEDGDS